MKIQAGVRIGLTAALMAAFLGIFWLVNRHRLWERWETFQRLPVFGKSWANEVDKMEHLYPKDSVDYVFLGDSHMEQCEWQEFFPGRKVVNRGIGGETTSGLLSRLDALPASRIIFLQIGINDLLAGQKPDRVLPRYLKVVSDLEKKGARVVPTLVFYTRYSPDVNPEVSSLNEQLVSHFQKEGRKWLSINETLSEKESLKQTMTLDGIHLNPTGYACWIEKIRSFLEKEAGDFR